MRVRSAEQTEIDPLAKVWYEAWHDAHSQIVPPELTALRTLESFRDRIPAALPNVRVVGPFNEAVGFWVFKGSELDQLFVSAQVRGLGVAAALIADGEARLAESGVETAWLGCAIGNERAARFYEKCGWIRAGTMVSHLETTQGVFRWKFGALKSVCGRKVLP